MKKKSFFIFSLVLTLAAFGLSYIFAVGAGLDRSEHLAEFLVHKYIDSKELSVQVREEAKFSAENLSSLTVNLVSEDLNVKVVDGDEIRVTLKGRIFVADNALDLPQVIQSEIVGQAIKISLDQDALKSVIEQEGRRGKWRFQLNGGDIGLEVQIPRRIREIQVNGTSADLNFEGGDFQSVFFRLTSGDVEFKNFKSEELRFDIISGDLDGELEVQSLNGSTVSGDMDFKLRNPSPQVDLYATSGDIEIRFMTAADLKISLSAQSGEVEYKGKSYDGGYEGSLGDGLGDLRIRTLSGDIEVH